ncbi:diguanylate cyclase [Synechococcus sp. RSCCF101]|uniref:sensor domain-containing diguanylate cyclase n=1 Tax=Synechococcus sp. RSCCF101 TaxID=2511069 RepID=UPI001248500C|nr:sensor domain-containing diguanylate cyclase [Synechococcus sp. RSCCF101]QEY31285.1 diguanylate cyclase [Synechococcus sp. RSCCF101]
MKATLDSYQDIIEHLHDGLYFVDRNRVITFWNHAAERISGYKAEEVVGRSCSDNILTHVDADGNQLCLGLCPLAATMDDGSPREADVYMHHKDGHRIPVAVRVSPMTDDQGRITGGIELFNDISNQAANELRVKELERMAYLDPLTRLANRNYITQELTARFQEHERYGVPFGVLFMDIDHFKRFNDTYGHDVGDQVLQLVANTFTTNARPFDLFGRWGGEEFLAVIRNVTPHDLRATGDRMRMLIEHSYLSHERTKLKVTISVGATLVLPDDDQDSLVKRADDLLYRSKADGRNRITMG